jgi:hypothetical protein
VFLYANFQNGCAHPKSVNPFWFVCGTKGSDFNAKAEPKGGIIVRCQDFYAFPQFWPA